MNIFDFDRSDDYYASEKQLAYVTGTQDQFDYDIGNKCGAYSGLVDVHEGNSQEVRLLFNHRFNQLVRYHSNLWRNVPPENRDRDYYDYRYMRFFEDFYRLCEKFPNLHELDHDYDAALSHCTAYEDAYDKRHAPSEEFYRNSRPWRFFA